MIWNKHSATALCACVHVCVCVVCMCMLVAQLCPAVCDTMDYSPPDSSVHGSPRILEWVAIPFSRGPSQPSDQTQVSCIAGRFFIIWATREAHTWVQNRYRGEWRWHALEICVKWPKKWLLKDVKHACDEFYQNYFMHVRLVKKKYLIDKLVFLDGVCRYNLNIYVNEIKTLAFFK